MKIVVLGAGRVGSTIAADLATEPQFHVLAVDRNPGRLAALHAHPAIERATGDLGDPATIRDFASGADLIVSAVPGHMGSSTLRAVLESGVDVVDISFFPEDPFELDDLARRGGVVAIVDCGVAPGLSNLLVGRVAARLDRVERVSIYVGGLPAVRDWPYEYRAVFSPVDVIEEYTRPSRIVRSGQPVVKPALSGRERLTLAGVGTVEAFLTDGLRTLLRTIPADEMTEKTLRYPGHADLMEILRETGFFDVNPVDVPGGRARPIDVTAALLSATWALREGDEDLTVLRVAVEGVTGSRRLRTTFDLLDRFDRATGTTSMARTTGFTATAAARWVARGGVPDAGIIPPELLGADSAAADFILQSLRERRIECRECVEEIG